MALYTRSEPVLVDAGEEMVPLTTAQLAADVITAAGGVAAITGPGLPSGGTTGQIPAKASGEDYDVAWTDAWAADADAAISSTRRLGTGASEAAPGANALGVVAHGASAATARPSGYAQVLWVGSVEPDNRAAGDLWVETS